MWCLKYTLCRIMRVMIIYNIINMEELRSEYIIRVHRICLQLLLIIEDLSLLPGGEVVMIICFRGGKVPKIWAYIFKLIMSISCYHNQVL